MKKIILGLAVFFSFYTISNYADNTAKTNNDSPIPCYNGGFSFGLAGYNTNPNPSDTHSAVDSFSKSDSQQAQSRQEPDYR